MFNEVRTYAPQEVILTFGGYAVEGWDSISVTRSTKEFSVVKGIRSKNTRIRNLNSHATISLQCPQTSQVNQILTHVLSVDEVTGNGKLEINLVDGSGNEVFTSSEAFIAGSADRSYGGDESERTWTIECLTSRWGDANRSFSAGNMMERIISLF